MSRVARGQLDDVPSAAFVHAALNAILTGPAMLEWDATANTLTITGTLYCFALSSAAYTGGVISSLSGTGNTAVLSYDRDDPAAVPVAMQVAQNVFEWADSTTLDPGGTHPHGGEGLVVLGHRAPDGSFFLRTGQVIPDGGALFLAARQYRSVVVAPAGLVGIADYSDILASGTAMEGDDDTTASDVSLGVTYVVGSGSLEVYVNGVLQEPDYLLGDFGSGDIGAPGFPAFETAGPRGAYHEINNGARIGTTIQFYAGHVPAEDDRIQAIVRS